MEPTSNKIETAGAGLEYVGSVNLSPLNTPLLSSLTPSTTPMFPTSAGDDTSPARTSGLFNHATDENTLPDLSTDLITGHNESEVEGLESLPAGEVEDLLAELDKDQPHSPSLALDTDKTSPAADHDYSPAAGVEEDWSILSEFMDVTKELNLAADPAAPADAGFLADANPFMDLNLDLAPYLLAGQEAAAAPGADVFRLEDEEEVVATAQEEAQFTVSVVSAGKAGAGGRRDNKYWERRRKNNIASQASRRTRKEKRVAMEQERDELEGKNALLKADIERLTSLAAEWKQRLLTLIA